MFPGIITLTYGFGVGLAALAGVLAAPIYSVNPNMGADTIIVVFAVVVIGGMGSILGSVVTGFGLGLVEGSHQGVLPRGLRHGDLRHHGAGATRAPVGPVREGCLMTKAAMPGASRTADRSAARMRSVWTFLLLALAVAAAPFVLYPVFVMKVLCFALFACAFNLLLGYGGLLSFGHAAFFGTASYVCAYCRQDVGRDARGRRFSSARSPPARSASPSVRSPYGARASISR